MDKETLVVSILVVVIGFLAKNKLLMAVGFAFIIYSCIVKDIREGHNKVNNSGQMPSQSPWCWGGLVNCSAPGCCKNVPTHTCHQTAQCRMPVSNAPKKNNGKWDYNGRWVASWRSFTPPRKTHHT